MVTTEKRTTQHTPGPWTNQRKGGEAFICGSSVHVASVPIVDEQDEANARLIAAAPEMLDMLDQAAQLFAYFAKTHGFETCAGMAQRIGGLLATVEDRA